MNVTGETTMARRPSRPKTLDPELRARVALDRFPVPRGLRASIVRDADGSDLLVLSQPLAAPLIPDALTAAERDVVRRLLAGRSNEAIAAARRTSVRTVANQVAAIFRKLGVASRSELIAKLYDDKG